MINDKEPQPRRRGPKRNKDQRLFARARIAELSQQGYHSQDIADKLLEETGISVSREQVTYDLRKVRDAWRTSALENYTFYINQEIAWTENFEHECWQAWRRSTSLKDVAVIERAARDAIDSGADPQMVVSQITTSHRDQAGDPRYLELALKARQDLRRLLGLYQKENKTVNATIFVKGYTRVTPDDWDEDVIDGELSEPPALAAGRAA